MVDVKKLHMEKHYEGNNILSLESGVHLSIRRFVLPFLTLFNKHSIREFFQKNFMTSSVNGRFCTKENCHDYFPG